MLTIVAGIVALIAFLLALLLVLLFVVGTVIAIVAIFTVVVRLRVIRNALDDLLGKFKAVAGTFCRGDVVRQVSDLAVNRIDNLHLVAHVFLESRLARHRTYERRHQRTDCGVGIFGRNRLLQHWRHALVKVELAGDGQVVAAASKAFSHAAFDSGILQEVCQIVDALIWHLVKNAKVAKQDVTNLVI